LKVSKAVKDTGERLGKLGEESAAGHLKDDEMVQSYLAHSGPQGMQISATQRQMLAQQEADRKKAKAEKKMKKLEKGLGGLGAAIGGMVNTAKRAGSPPADPKKEQDLERAAQDLARKIAQQHGFKLEVEEATAKVERQMPQIEDAEKQKTEEMPKEDEASDKPTVEVANTPEAEQKEEEGAPARNWAAFEDATMLPPSESDIQLAEKLRTEAIDPFDTSRAQADAEEMATRATADPFAPVPKEQVSQIQKYIV
jgi:hypothetical protein